MVKLLDSNDFRARRKVLEPEDFALGPSTEEEPTDSISQSVWDSLQTGPDDVAVRTSNHHGTELTTLDSMATAWVDLNYEAVSNDVLVEAGMTLYEEFTAAVFLILHGYYRQAAACFRAALDYVTNAGDRIFNPNPPAQPRFGSGCDVLSNSVFSKWPGVPRSENPYVQKDGTRNLPAGWVRELYDRLSDYSHARPGFTNGELWESNGPIYATRPFIDLYNFARETYAVAWLTTRICGATVPSERPTVESGDSWRATFSAWLSRV